ncbi:hypothetical protein EVA_11013 [gut metagenome]|uniref:Uncharacterized protein n=1 Tax=gut metagenome TaxID=749906 RepID=J9G0W8_9ZZZZ
MMRRWIGITTIIIVRSVSVRNTNGLHWKKYMPTYVIPVV